jgi:GAF domain-containing protein
VAQTEQDRLRAVVDAAIAVTSELSIDAVLQRIVEAAARLTGARYAALGVIDQRGTGLENFVTTGLDEETIRRIDPRSVGFPDRAIGVIVA